MAKIKNMQIVQFLNPDLQKKLNENGLEKFLNFLGKERLKQKKIRMENLLKIADPDEALYRELMLALGYKNNKVQFLELAMILPYSEICKLKSQEVIENALLYRAGFSKSKEGLPENFDFSLKMEKSVWQSLNNKKKVNMRISFIKSMICTLPLLVILLQTQWKRNFSVIKRKTEGELLLQ